MLQVEPLFSIRVKTGLGCRLAQWNFGNKKWVHNVPGRRWFCGTLYGTMAIGNVKPDFQFYILSHFCTAEGSPQNVRTLDNLNSGIPV